MAWRFHNLVWNLAGEPHGRWRRKEVMVKFTSKNDKTATPKWKELLVACDVCILKSILQTAWKWMQGPGSSIFLLLQLECLCSRCCRILFQLECLCSYDSELRLYCPCVYCPSSLIIEVLCFRYDIFRSFGTCNAFLKYFINNEIILRVFNIF